MGHFWRLSNIKFQEFGDKNLMLLKQLLMLQIELKMGNLRIEKLEVTIL